MLPTMVVGYACKKGWRITVSNANHRKWMKRRYNRNFRHQLNQQVRQGIEAYSEFQPRQNTFMTFWHVA